ncbi:MAG: DUF2232 domain-containing protein [Thermoleophilia bacterium]|jgi:uncharacterized protein YybS (DUF2232 family)
MSSKTEPVLPDISKAIAASTGLGIAIAFMPLLAVVAVPALPVPVAYITSRHGFLSGFIVSLLAGAVCMGLTAPLLGVYAGLLIVMVLMLAGIGGGFAINRGMPQLRLFMFMAAIFFVTLFLWLGALLLITGNGPVSATNAMFDMAVEPSRQLYQSMGMSEQDIDSNISDARDFASSLPYMAPALVLLASLLFSGVNMAIARWSFERLGRPFPKDFIFRDFRAHWAFAYVFIFGLLCQLMVPYAPDTYSYALELTGANLYIVTSVLFFIQGLAVASFFLRAYKVTRVKQVAVYTVLILLEALMSLTMWMGLFDTWLDYRHRFGKNKTR